MSEITTRVHVDPGYIYGCLYAAHSEKRRMDGEVYVPVRITSRQECAFRVRITPGGPWCLVETCRPIEDTSLYEAILLVPYGEGLAWAHDHMTADAIAEVHREHREIESMSRRQGPRARLSWRTLTGADRMRNISHILG